MFSFQFLPFWAAVLAGLIYADLSVVWLLVALFWCFLPELLQFVDYALLARRGFFGSVDVRVRVEQFNKADFEALLLEPEISWSVYMNSCNCPRCWAVRCVNLVPVVPLLWPVLWLPAYLRVFHRLTGV